MVRPTQGARRGSLSTTSRHLTQTSTILGETPGAKIPSRFTIHPFSHHLSCPLHLTICPTIIHLIIIKRKEIIFISSIIIIGPISLKMAPIGPKVAEMDSPANFCGKKKIPTNIPPSTSICGCLGRYNYSTNNSLGQELRGIKNKIELSGTNYHLEHEFQALLKRSHKFSPTENFSEPNKNYFSTNN